MTRLVSTSHDASQDSPNRTLRTLGSSRKLQQCPHTHTRSHEQISSGSMILAPGRAKVATQWQTRDRSRVVESADHELQSPTGPTPTPTHPSSPLPQVTPHHTRSLHQTQKIFNMIVSHQEWCPRVGSEVEGGTDLVPAPNVRCSCHGDTAPNSAGGAGTAGSRVIVIIPPVRMGPISLANMDHVVGCSTTTLHAHEHAILLRHTDAV
jgi:hypothetical protein